MRHKSTELMDSIQKFAEQYYQTNRHSLSTTEIADAVSIAHGTAYKYLVTMNENGMIRYDGQQISTDKTDKIRTDLTSVPALTLPRGFDTEDGSFVEDAGWHEAAGRYGDIRKVVDDIL